MSESVPIEDQPLVSCIWEEIPVADAAGRWWKRYRAVTVPLGVAVDGVQRGVARIVDA